jgi:SAM-dependent methyltransferase
MSAGRSEPRFEARGSFAAEWQAELDRGISLSGEDKGYFVRGRVSWLRDRLRRLGRSVDEVMDFGCGLGDTCAVLLDGLGARTVLGVDVSEGMVAAARAACAAERIRFEEVTPSPEAGRFDLIYTSGVFHHIPPSQRAGWLRYLHTSLRPGGVLALWENNPWNPGTRLVMSRIPFDRDAVPITPAEARRLVRAAGFEVVATDHLFVFPRALRGLRRLEPALSRFPLGAQYQVLAARCL